MKSRGWLLCFHLLFALVMASGQDSLVQAYKGLSRDIRLSEYGACDSIELNGRNVSRIRSNRCMARVSFDILGKQRIEIMKNDKLVKAMPFDVQPLPEIRLEYARQTGGEMTAAAFLKQVGPYTAHDDYSFPEKVYLSSFDVELLRGKERIFKRLNYKGRFNTEISNLLERNLRDGDTVIFSEVFAEIEGFNPFPIKGLSIRIDND